jgi:uncharacterized damage-inducible protein DinB
MSSELQPMAPPQPDEHSPYYTRYVSLVPRAEIVGILQQQAEDTEALRSLSDEEACFRYAPDKWSIKQLLGHIIDTERIFAYRALRIARGDQTPMEGFEQDDYVRNGPFERISMTELMNEYVAVRTATVSLFRHLPLEAWTRRGIANKNEVTVRAIAYIIAGHELHHRQILKEKYFPAMKPSDTAGVARLRSKGSSGQHV